VDSTVPEVSMAENTFAGSNRHCTGLMPESVAIVALGPSQRVWINGNGTYERGIPRCDEVWCLNKGLRTLKCDVGFILDDLVGEARRSSEYAEDIKHFGLPIITTSVDHDVKALFPEVNLHELPMEKMHWQMGVRWLLATGMPVEEIIKRNDHVKIIGEDLCRYTTNSVPVMIAYALYIGVRRIYLYGADYTYPGQDATEDGRGSCSYWVGFARAQGMQVHVNKDSTLLDTRDPKKLYGYARQPLIRTPSEADIRTSLLELGIEHG